MVSSGVCKKRKVQQTLEFTGPCGGDGGIRTHGTVRYNWFRVSPVMTTSIRLHVCQTRLKHSEPQKWGKTKMLERRVRTTNYSVFWTRQNPWKKGKTGGRKSLSYREFRVVLVMTSSIRLHIYQLAFASWTLIQFFLEPLLEPAKNFKPKNQANPFTASTLSNPPSNNLTTFRVRLVCCPIEK